MITMVERASAAGYHVGLLFAAAQAASPLSSSKDKTHPRAPALPQHAAQRHTCSTALCKLSSTD